MCPACLAASAVIALKAASAGGATALAVKALRSKFAPSSPETDSETSPEGEPTHETAPNRNAF